MLAISLGRDGVGTLTVSALIERPLVSVVIPVLNGAEFLEQCIESVLGQTYPNWEIVVLDNASTDTTSRILAHYSSQDARIEVHRNAETVPMIENWNRAMNFISRESSYCRVLHADDWMYPSCLEKCVDLAIRHPSAAFVSSLRLRGNTIQGHGLSSGRELFSGRDVARQFFQRHSFWLSPTCSMLRSDVVRDRNPFYPDKYLHADLAAYFDIMCSNDFGFIDEVLAFSRPHASSVTSTTAAPKETLLPEWLSFFDEYGERLFENEELQELKTLYLRHYYRRIVRGAVTLKGKEFLAFHLSALRRAGRSPTATDLIRAAIGDIGEAVTHPGKTLRYLGDRLTGRPQ